jgi:cytochrome c oxidase subunit 3
MAEHTSDAHPEATKAPAPPVHGHESHGHGHDHGHGHNPNLAHHFDTPQQQFDAGKLGIWLFLLTEVLFFSGLFCAYTIYRAMRPEVFVYAHYFLDTKLVEYSHKYHDGLLPGKNFHPAEQVWETHSFKHKHPEAAEYAAHLVKRAAKPAAGAAEPAYVAPKKEQIAPLLQAGVLGPKAETPNVPSKPRNAHVFFSIYFFMTGLHGFHVLAGIGVFVWLLIRAKTGVFGPDYFGPIDYAALYWHLVDLIWIYLFPLLYLIH